MKKKRRVIIPIIIASLVILAGLISFLAYSQNENVKTSVDNVVENVIEKISEVIPSIGGSKTEDSQSDNFVPNSNQPAGGGGGGGGGDGTSPEESSEESGDEEETDILDGESDCNIQISYSLEPQDKEIVCNNRDGEICIDKTVTCSVNVKNLDEIISGNFKIEFAFVEEGKMQEDAFSIKTDEEIIQSKSNAILTSSTSITSQGADGIANKNIICFYKTLEVPKKMVC